MQAHPTLGGCPSLASSCHSKSSTSVTSALQIRKACEPPTIAPSCVAPCQMSHTVDWSSQQNAGDITANRQLPVHRTNLNFSLIMQ